MISGKLFLFIAETILLLLGAGIDYDLNKKAITWYAILRIFFIFN